MSNVEWENGMVGIPVNVPLVPALDQIGREGWEGWAVLSQDEKNIVILVKRRKQAITVATEMPNSNGLIKN